MSRRKVAVFSVAGVVVLAVGLVVLAWFLTQASPGWYVPTKLSEKELLAVEQQMIATGAEFKSASEVAEPFILELSGRQINEMLTVSVSRDRFLPRDIADPAIALGEGVLWLGARITWKNQQSVASIRIRPFVDSAGLLHIQMDKLKAGALGLPDNWLGERLDELERSLKARLAVSTSESDTARTARKNQAFIDRLFAALRGTPTPTSFVTREDLQMSVEAIRISPERMEIQFRPVAKGDQQTTERND